MTNPDAKQSMLDKEHQVTNIKSEVPLKLTIAYYLQNKITTGKIKWVLSPQLYAHEYIRGTVP
jgi:hypothetical protein